MVGAEAKLREWSRGERGSVNKGLVERVEGLSVDLAVLG